MIMHRVRELSCAQTDRQTERTTDKRQGSHNSASGRLGEAIALMIVAKDTSRHAGITMHKCCQDVYVVHGK